MTEATHIMNTDSDLEAKIAAEVENIRAILAEDYDLATASYAIVSNELDSGEIQIWGFPGADAAEVLLATDDLAAEDSVAMFFEETSADVREAIDAEFGDEPTRSGPRGSDQ
jgi:uncharacterized membrane protein